MKKFILTAAAAGALAFTGAASAQSFGDVLGSILGFGQPSYNYNQGYGTYGGTYPGVVAASPYGSQGQMYVDQYGRQFYYDQYGRQVFVQAQTQQTYHAGYDQHGRQILRDSWGNYMYSDGSRYYGSVYSQPRSYSSWDRDGDGVANRSDRWPDDRRYW